MEGFHKYSYIHTAIKYITFPWNIQMHCSFTQCRCINHRFVIPQLAGIVSRVIDTNIVYCQCENIQCIINLTVSTTVAYIKTGSVIFQPVQFNQLVIRIITNVECKRQNNCRCIMPYLGLTTIKCWLVANLYQKYM